MFAESGRAREALRPMTAAFEQWLSPRLEDGSYFGWMLEDAGVVIAGLGMMVIDWPPHPSHPADHRRAYILNVFVEPEHRREGLAKRLMALPRRGPANSAFAMRSFIRRGRGGRFTKASDGGRRARWQSAVIVHQHIVGNR
jgi:GNAT superfamily N-acetyltransferase